MSDPTVNIPLLRKAVEWAEAEAAKPPAECLWIQELWETSPDDHGYARTLRQKRGLTTECGTTYCIAGYICEAQGFDAEGGWADPAADALGLVWDALNDDTPAARLFNAGNTIEDVRRIAEEIAGERL